MKSLAVAALLRRCLPDVRVRFANLARLRKRVPNRGHPHRLTGGEIEALFTRRPPVVFNFHACPWLIHRPTERGPRRCGIHPRAYKRLKGAWQFQYASRAGDWQWHDRFSLAIDALDPIRRLRLGGSSARKALLDREIACKNRGHEFGVDPPRIVNRQWPF